MLHGPRPDAKEQSLAKLEDQLGQATNRHYEERFIWILVTVVLFNAYVFTQMANWAGAVVIGILELIGILVMADRCKVNTVAPFIDQLTGAFRRVSRLDAPPPERPPND